MTEKEQKLVKQVAVIVLQSITEFHKKEIDDEQTYYCFLCNVLCCCVYNITKITLDNNLSDFEAIKEQFISNVNYTIDLAKTHHEQSI